MSNSITNLHFIDGKMLVSQFDKGLSIAEIEHKVLRLILEVQKPLPIIPVPL